MISYILDARTNPGLRQHVNAWQSIDALDLVSDAAMDDVTGLEMDIKETLAKSIDGLRAATGR